MKQSSYQSLLFKYEFRRVTASIYQAQSKDPMKILEDIQSNYDIGSIEEIVMEDVMIGEITDQLRKKLEEFHNVFSLGFNRCGLTSLGNLPTLPIQRFTADGNQLNAKTIDNLRKYSTLKSLSLICNQIESSDSKYLVKYLKQTQIQQLNLYGNPIQDYAKEMFDQVQSLIIIDNLLDSGIPLMYDTDNWSDLQQLDGYVNQDTTTYETKI